MNEVSNQSIRQILNNNILRTFVLHSLILGAIFAVLIYYIQRRGIELELEHELDTYETSLETRLNNISERVSILGKNHFIVNSLVSGKQMGDVLDKLLKGEIESSFVKKAFVLDSEEKVVYQTGTPENISELGLYFARTFQEGRVAFLWDLFDNRYFISAPIMYYQTPQGALVFEINMEEVFARLKLGDEVSLAVDFDGQIVRFHPDVKPYWQLKRNLDLNGLGPATLSLIVSHTRILGPLYRFLFLYILLVLIFVLGAYWLSRKVSLKLSRPLRELKDIVEDKLSLHRLQKPVADESNELSLIREAFYKQAVQLREINKDLEQRVIDRTKDLNLLLIENEFYKWAITTASLVVETDIKGNILEVNDPFCAISHYSRKELLGQNIRIVNSNYHDDSFWKELWETLSAGNVWRGKIRNKAKGGHFYWVDVLIVPRRDERVTGEVISYLSIQNDITQSKLYEEQMLTEKKKAEDAASAKAQFLASMSHEIRTPMNAILAMGEILAESTKLDAEEQHYLDLLNNSGRTLLQLINDILDFSKIEEGAIDLEKENFDVELLVQEVIDLFYPLIEKKELSFHYNTGLQHKMRQGDTTRIKQILFNLVGNAMKFTSKGSISIQLHEEAENRILFEIADTGIGIPEDKLQMIFERFSQADRSTTRQFGGTGLGLSICKGLVEMMGGEIVVKSELGVGSVFSFTAQLPLSESTEKRGEGLVQVDLDMLEKLRGRILIVDDSLENIEVLKLFLKSTQLEIITAINGEVALDILGNESFDVVFMDVEMPVMDGITAMKKIRVQEMGTGRKQRVVALSAHAVDYIKHEIMQAGFDDYMTKPITKHKIHNYLITHMKE